MKSSNRANDTPALISEAFAAAVLPDGWSKSTGYLPQDFYGYPIYGNGMNAAFDDLRDSGDNAYTQIIWGTNGNSLAQQIGSPMPIYASPAGSRLNGSESGNSSMYGSSGDDQFYPHGSGNIINGGGGYNGVFYSNPHNLYLVSKNASTVTVIGPNGTDDTLINIQYLHFSEESVPIN